MSKELELFRQIIKGYTEMFNMAIHHPKDTIVKWEGVEEIEKSLKALEIIKKKRVNVQVFIICSSGLEYEDYKRMLEAEIYNGINSCSEFPLTQEEYDLLKEVLL